MQNEQNAQAPNSTPPWIRSSRARSLLAGVVCLTAVAYTAGVVFGIISQEHRIDATNLIILGLAALIALLLVKPEALDQLRRFKLAGFELEIENLKRSQELQQGQLEAISLLLPLVLREEEIKHLRNLSDAKTSGYVGGHPVRTELRRLATLGLVERIDGRMMRELKDNMNFDLAKYVRLTPFGRRMVTQLEEIEKAKLDKKV